MNTFKETYSFIDRQNDAIKIMNKYTNCIPVICQRSTFASVECPYINKNKYLVPMTMTIGQFIFVIRKRLKMSSEKGLFLYINNHIPSSSRTFSEIYNIHKDGDYFLYITYSFENMFG